jgi:hypothetical protein
MTTRRDRLKLPTEHADEVAWPIYRQQIRTGCSTIVLRFCGSEEVLRSCRKQGWQGFTGFKFYYGLPWELLLRDKKDQKDKEQLLCFFSLLGVCFSLKPL